jgi:antitoxin component YwqK of YwqJK toxin-antitoxin module
MRKTVLHIIILLTFISCNNDSRKEKTELIESTESTQIEKIDSIVKYRSDGTKEYIIPTVNGIKTGNKIWFDNNQNIIGFEHYQNDSLNGYGLMLNENFRPKYLFEKNNGKRDGVIIEFYENGVIKSFRSADIYHDSQNIKFHENGTIKSIGQTKKGRGNGTTFYFDRNGILEKTVELENGNIKK